MTPQPSNWSTSLWPYCMAFSISRQETFSRKGSHTWIQELTYSMFSRSRGSARPLPTEIVFITTKASQSTGTGLCWLTAPCPVTVHTLEPGGHLICSPALKDSSIFSKCSNYREIKCLPIPESKQNLRKEKKSNMQVWVSQKSSNIWHTV